MKSYKYVTSRDRMDSLWGIVAPVLVRCRSFAVASCLAASSYEKRAAPSGKLQCLVASSVEVAVPSGEAAAFVATRNSQEVEQRSNCALRGAVLHAAFELTGWECP